MKRFVELFKILWNDDRGKALIKLGFYLVFMVFVVVYAQSIHSRSESELKELTLIEKYAKKVLVNEVITIDNKTYDLTFDKEIKMISDDVSYSVLNNVVTVDSNNEIIDFKVYFWNITPKLIGNLVKDKKTYYVTRYDDNIKDKAYKIPLTDFLANFEGIGSEIEFLDQISKEEILIVIKHDNKKVLSVNIDLTSYYKLITGTNEEFKLEIEY